MEKITEAPAPAVPFTLTNIDNFRCDNPVQYPYHPLTTAIELYEQTYLAAKTRDTIVVLVLSKDKAIQSHPFDQDVLPLKSSISSLLFIPPQAAEKGRPVQQNTPGSKNLYLLIGFYSGYLLLVQFNRKQTKLVLRLNKAQSAPESLLSRTFSFIYSAGSNQADYPVWQKHAIIKAALSKNTVAYLLRNGVLVIMNTINVNMELLQKGFQGVLKMVEDETKKAAGISRAGLGGQSEFYQTGKGKSWKMIRGHEGAILGFDKTVSCFYLDQTRLIVGTFEGQLYFFDRATLKCVVTVVTSIAIKSVTCHQKYILLCLQDDCVQILDLSSNKYINIAGHRSFPNTCYLYKGVALTSAFDGTLNVAEIPDGNKWTAMRVVKQQDKLYTWTAGVAQAKNQIVAREKFQVGKGEAGIGSYLLLGDLIIFSMLDNFVRIYRLTST